ncbi:hypothetical protein ZWY2020_000440 [Hordeum vulgare]|nr:hypothetical protein ZWY2020_000440 [Hordeum vulgare]
MRRWTGSHQRPPRRPAPPRPHPPPLRPLSCAHQRPLPPVARPLVPPGHLNINSIGANLSCFHRATSIELDSFFLFLRVPAGVDVPALEMLSLSGMLTDLDQCFK